eukprot:214090-Rhodomonas_salina.1
MYHKELLALVVDGALRLDVPPAQLAVVQSVQIDVIGAGADIGAGFPLAATPLRPHRLVVPRVVVRRRKAAGAPDPVLLGDAPLAVFAARQILVDKRVVERRPVGVFVALHIPPGDPRVVGEAIQIHGVRGLLADAPLVRSQLVVELFVGESLQQVLDAPDVGARQVQDELRQRLLVPLCLGAQRFERALYLEDRARHLLAALQRLGGDGRVPALRELVVERLVVQRCQHIDRREPARHHVLDVVGLPLRVPLGGL